MQNELLAEKPRAPGLATLWAPGDKDVVAANRERDRMEAIGGKVYPRALSEVKQTVDAEETAAMKADLAQMKAEQAKAHADRKAKLQEKINQLDSKIQAQLEKAKEQRAAVERQAKAKVEILKAKAAALKAKAAEKFV